MVSILKLFTAYQNVNAIQVTANTEINVSHNYVFYTCIILSYYLTYQKCYPYADGFFQIASYSLTSMNNMYYSFIGDVIVLNFTKTNICL